MSESEILDLDLGSNDSGTAVELISVNKFIILSFLSLGLYTFWWSYKSWKFFKVKDKLDVMPLMRAVFSIFYTFSLFETIQNFAKSKGYTESYSSSGLFILFIVLNVLSRLPDPYWLISMFSFVSFIPALKAYNFGVKNAEDYQGVERNGFNARQIVLIVIGSIFWLLLGAALMVVENEVY